ncbi:NADPH-dependent FMN reductase [Ktedonospora formicarum]|uniref:NADPH-dependent FMN reductase-like domain-containing protein n=1 Tax=Ktedonospora formicarum TaxID=2778364 RepID=A0A8J3I852_9CHLR|nr:NADPH-dependent FMN reductase [Ktedonospora formicarum]GHO50391.1 hypothetical protein KSX_85540 [Ktedonospora formicarum]
MRILAISGSLRISSTNTSLVRAATTLAPENMHIMIYTELGTLPPFSPELDGDDAPASVKELRAQIQSSDGVLICTPEYAYGMPGSLKNALDWTVSSGDLHGKPLVAISASPGGGERALASLLLTLQALNAKVAEGGTLSIFNARAKVDAHGNVADEATVKDLKAILEALARAIAGE